MCKEMREGEEERERTVLHKDNGLGTFVCCRERERERERENSELYYSRIKILGSCLFLQSVPANLHANRLHIKQ